VNVIEVYWFDTATKQGIKGTNYNKSKIHSHNNFIQS